HVVETPFARVARVLDAEQQVLTYREAWKNVAGLGNITKAEMGNLVARHPRDVRSLEPDRALRRNLSHNGFDGRRATDAVSTEQAHNLSCIDMHLDALANVTLA